MSVVLESVLTCPHCGFARQESMPTNACQYFYECRQCKALLRPRPGDCCVFCSFGSMPCPPVQLQRLSLIHILLYAAQRAGQLARTGPYARLRHPQYIGFVLIMLGFLLQWPTLLILLMFPVLMVMYGRLSLAEERESAMRFGKDWQDYASQVPRFFPRLG